MHFLSKETNIDFVGVRYYALAISVVLLLISGYAIVTKGLNFGIDFTGGTMIEVGYPTAVNLDEVRSTLENGGYDNAIVQNFGSLADVLIRLPAIETENTAEISNNIMTLLKAEHGDEIELRRVEFVGPQVGEELAEDGGLAVLYAMIGILIYIAMRFEYRFAISSVAALVHDVIITVGYFALFEIDFDLTVLAAILAVIGYSLNDTIVIFDRVRENFLKMRKATPLEVINKSINGTLGRTLITAGTTLFVVIALYVLGGEAINAFALALILGIVIGTYSSMYIAGTAVLLMGVTKNDLMKLDKEETDANPDGSQV